MRRTALMGLLCTLAFLGAGCPYQATNSLPEHVKTVQVNTFENRTFYKGMEAKLSRAMIDHFNRTPGIRVVNSDGDATLYGQILTVQDTVLQVDARDRPSSTRVRIDVEYTFRDNRTGEDILETRRLSSTSSSSDAGRFDPDLGETRASAESAALEQLAKSLVRVCVGDDW